jgi:hypothetical protein
MNLPAGTALRRGALAWLLVTVSFAANSTCLADNAWGNSRNSWGANRNAWGSTSNAWGSNPNAWGSSANAWGSMPNAWSGAPSPKAGNGWPNAGRGKSGNSGAIGKIMPEAIVANHAMASVSIQYRDTGAIPDGLQITPTSGKWRKLFGLAARRDSARRPSAQ